MKNVIIYLMASLALFACQDELEVEKTTKPGKELLRVSVNIPESGLPHVPPLSKTTSRMSGCWRSTGTDCSLNVFRQPN